MSDATTTAPNATPRTRSALLVDEFTSFRAELDRSQAQRERIVKLSRDVTALSKQMIFSLHRVATGAAWPTVRADVAAKLDALAALFRKLAPEVRGEDFWRYERSISPGLQEYLEGLTFYHYLEHGTLPTLAQCQASLVPPPPPPPAPDSTTLDASTTTTPNPPTVKEEDEEPYVLMTAEDYLGGVADLTGELMRLAIASVGKSLHLSLQPPPTTSTIAGGDGVGQEASNERCADIDEIAKLVREIKGEMDPLASCARWLPKKLVVLDQSLGKIESASYNLKIRGAEYADATTTTTRLATTTREVVAA
ncbi:hypothetical protein JCM11491_006663 [Sporobolomyces phaffii]